MRHILVVLLVVMVVPTLAEAEAPGELLTVNGHELHLYCTGEGSGPTVVLESGVGGFTLNWTAVQAQLSAYVRVCSYDRRGYGWSAPATTPFDLDRAVTDLDLLLEAAGESAPYVFVSHSFGGVVSRAYHAAHPDKVAGLVLVDAVHLEMPNRITTYPPALRAQLRQLNIITDTLRLLILNGETEVEALTSFLPEDADERYFDKVFEDKFIDTTIIEANYMLNEMPDVDLPETLGNLPLVVISHGIPERNSFLGASIGREAAAQAEVIWQTLQVELVGLSSQGRLVIAEESQHSIQFDQPELVVDVVREVLAEVR